MNQGSKNRVLQNYGETSISYSYQNDEITQENVDFFSVNDAIKALSSPTTKSTITALSGVTLAVSPFTGVMMLRLFQIFDMLNFVKVTLPSNFLKFMELFSSNLFDIMPNFIQMDEKNHCKLDEKFIENEMDCWILNNAGNIFIQLFLALIFKLIIIFAENKINSMKNAQKAQKIIKKVDHYFNLAFFVNFMIASNMDLNLSAFINLRNFWVKPFNMFINSVLSVITILIYLRLVVMLINKGMKLKKILLKIQKQENLKQKKISKDRIRRRENSGLDLLNDSSILSLRNSPEDQKHAEMEEKVKQEDDRMLDWIFLGDELKDNLDLIPQLIYQMQFTREFFLCFIIVFFIDYPFL